MAEGLLLPALVPGVAAATQAGQHTHPGGVQDPQRELPLQPMQPTQQDAPRPHHTREGGEVREGQQNMQQLPTGGNTLAHQLPAGGTPPAQHEEELQLRWRTIPAAEAVPLEPASAHASLGLVGNDGLRLDLVPPFHEEVQAVVQDESAMDAGPSYPDEDGMAAPEPYILEGYGCVPSAPGGTLVPHGGGEQQGGLQPPLLDAAQVPLPTTPPTPASSEASMLQEDKPPTRYHGSLIPGSEPGSAESDESYPTWEDMEATELSEDEPPTHGGSEGCTLSDLSGLLPSGAASSIADPSEDSYPFEDVKAGGRTPQPSEASTYPQWEGSEITESCSRASPPGSEGGTSTDSYPYEDVAPDLVEPADFDLAPKPRYPKEEAILQPDVPADGEEESDGAILCELLRDLGAIPCEEGNVASASYLLSEMD